MSPDVLILGQGLAGTLLAWELEKARVSFLIVDPGHAAAATMAAAGIINPVTGRRLVKSWRVDDLRPQAEAAYREIEGELGVRLWFDMRVRRLFADGREHATFRAKGASGELAPFVGDSDAEGFWVERAARVDVQRLLVSARERWRARGNLHDEAAVIGPESGRQGMTIDCRGLATTREVAFGFVPWEFSKGEVIELAVEGLAPDVILNRRHWVVPIDQGGAWVGATHEPGEAGRGVTTEARRILIESARGLLRQPFAVRGQRAGVRVNLPDKRPVVGTHPGQARIGIFNALGAKGALLAPWLARQWVEHFRTGATFDPEVDVRRFWRARGGD